MIVFVSFDFLLFDVIIMQNKSYGRYCMIVGFTTYRGYAISAYHH